MASVTHTEFGRDTTGSQVAASFPDAVRGKTILITGGNRHGLGFSAARALASQSPRRLIIAGRSSAKVQECIDALRRDFPAVDYRPLELDLSEQKSVRASAAAVLSWDDVPAIDLVINSAAVMCVEERTLTGDGVELHLATNHIGHWLLSCLIMPKLIKAAETNAKGATRVVNVSSGSSRWGGLRWSDMNFDKKNKDLPKEEQPIEGLMMGWGYSDVADTAYIPLDGYNRSKSANVLCGIGISRHLFAKHGILGVSVHPGVINTELSRHFPEVVLDKVDDMIEAGMFYRKSFEAGSSTTLVAALDPELSVGVGESKNGAENWGSYLEDCQICDKAHARCVSSQEADRLWAYSEGVVGQEFAW
ncbi:hypothetical protein Trco_004063 [Trichoderma cornu-damae]|uniref:Short-chain dehydrogenase n=1 Tax=Trichoderma cornu-damae TaxID=654480 RepID=A0A9P8QLS4_9HYPO|nr:hypothetical protein Trco_004063 [Trichoderma cornu-damae]